MTGRLSFSLSLFAKVDFPTPHQPMTKIFFIDLAYQKITFLSRRGGSGRFFT
jgi:hypothetical protein